jgi:hypothetical protein
MMSPVLGRLQNCTFGLADFRQESRAAMSSSISIKINNVFFVAVYKL